MSDTLQFPFNTDALTPICLRHDVARLGLFGSMARGESTAESDIDLLVEFAIPKSLLALVRLERELMEALKRNVDLLTEAALSPYLRDQILDELVIIYES